MKNKKGFSLVELLMVISIIGIISVIAAVSFSKAQKDGRDRRRIDDLKAVQNAAEQWFMLSGSYPAASYYVTNKNWTSSSGQIVLQRFPNDPQNKNYKVVNGLTNVNGYCICADLENIKNGNAENDTDCKFQNINAYYCIQNQQ